MSKEIIDLQNISKIFRVKTQDAIVLKKVDLTIDSGEFAIIFGPSGCGKSTLLHVLLGLEKPTTGTCRILQTNLYAYTEDQISQFRKSHVGMVYQQPNWIKSLSVVENVAFSLALNGVTKEISHRKALDMLKIVGIDHWADYLPSELSSGQQQKVALARALITDPQVIIADEPTGNLDYQSGVDLMNLFKKLQEQGRTVVMVTHNIDNVDYATQVIQMFDGQVVNVLPVNQKTSHEVKKNLLIHRNYTPTPDLIDPRTMLKNRQKRISFFSHFPPIFSLGAWKIGGKIFFSNIWQTARFICFLFIYLAQHIFIGLSKLPIIPSFIKNIFANGFQQLYKLQSHIDKKRPTNTISRSDLIDISIKNMWAKKTRTLITIGGMSIGIAAIVFLVSVGYGLEKLVISRVARLDEMKQIDAIPAVASNIKITDKSLAQFKQIQNVQKVLPIIGVVGKVTYNKSSIDVAAYGVPADYLKESAIKPVEGTLFTDASAQNPPKISYETSKGQARLPAGQVAGAETESGIYMNTYSQVSYSINSNAFLRVRSLPNTTGSLLGYTRHVEGQQTASEVWGTTYPDSKKGEAGSDAKGNKIGLWLKVTVPLWEEKTCSKDTEPDCEQNTYVPLKNEDGTQKTIDGYMAELSLTTSDTERTPQVLGISDTVSSDSAATTTDATNTTDTVESPTPVPVKTVQLDAANKRNAVVNVAFLKVLGLPQAQGLNKQFQVSFITTGSDGVQEQKTVSAPITYSIIGITPDTNSPIMYVPIADIKQMGVGSYSQVKLVVNNQQELATTRKRVEVLGYKTTSVVDTVSQIESLFSTFRVIMGLVGVVALSVAALGMFNTLTISLLERTREVGMMKAIGMQSEEVQDLFLTESMIMGLFGGMGGLILGYILGKIASAVLSVLALSKGEGFLDVTYIPLSFTLLIVFLSLAVGIITGMYPARRATKISALDALRYE